MQKWAGRINTPFMVQVTGPVNDDKQPVEGTWYFNEGDTVDVVAVDANGCIVGMIQDNAIVEGIDPGAYLILDQVVDTTSLPAGQTPYILCQTILSAQESIDRLYKRKFNGDVDYNRQEAIVDQDISGANGIYFVDDASFFRVGDKLDIQADEGLLADDAVIASIDINADEANNRSAITLTGVNVDATANTNPKFVSQDITVQEAIERNQERIDEIDRPIPNEYIGVGDGSLTVFDIDLLYRVGSTELYLDSGRVRLGTAGTRATLSNGAGTDQLDFTSLILGLNGNKTQVKLTDPAASSSPLSVAVSGNWSAGYDVDVSLETDGSNAIISTAKEVADLLNADATVKRILQAIYGGDGSGVQAALALTPLASGLDDGTGDYAELPQIYNNLNVNTGYKWVSFWILPNVPNRMKVPPRCDEELVVDYRQAMENVDR